jgi:hypothetical protein
MASNISGEIEMKLDKANATIRSQADELKKLRGEMRSTQAEAKKTGESMEKSGDSLNKQARRARSDLAVFGAQGRVIGQFAQGFTSLLGPIGLIGGTVMAASYAWEKFDEHMKGVIARSVELGSTQRELNRSMNEDAAKLGEKRIAGSEGRAKLQGIYQGQDAEKLVTDTVQSTGIEEEIVRKVLIAVGPRAKRLTGADRANYLDKVFSTFKIANIGGGVESDKIVEDFAKNPSITSIKGRAGRIAGMKPDDIVGNWMRFAGSEEVQKREKLARDKAQIDSRNKQQEAIKSNLEALDPAKQLEFYRGSVPAFSKAEKEIREKIEVAKKAKDARDKILEQTSTSWGPGNTPESVGELGSRLGELFTVGWKDAWASMGPDSGKALTKARTELQETSRSAAQQIGIPQELLMRLINATEATATTITTDMKR